MSLATDLHGYLTRRRELGAVVGGRLFVASVPVGVSMPYIVMQQVGLTSDPYLAGASGLYSASYQLDCYATTVETADRMANELRLALDGYQTDDFPTVALEGVTLEGDRMDVSYDRPGEQNYTHRRTLDFTLWYRDTVPSFPAP